VHTGLTGRWQQRWITRGLAPARFVICVSHNTAAELRVLLPGRQATVSVIPHTLNRDFTPVEGERIDQELMKLGLAAGTRYLLHVGGNSWYKNRLGVMRIFAELRKSPQFAELRLVLAGKPWAPEMREFSKTAGLEDLTVEATSVSDGALKVLYSGAVALLFPSLEEGFGWPILEAQACGCPVITSNRAPMPEVAGDAAILIDPTNPQAAAETILRRWNELPALREAGFRNLERFTEDKMAKAYIEAYEQVWAAHCAASKSG
jgi:glycosyltransferase involved in cell wall biosynthesis